MTLNVKNAEIGFPAMELEQRIMIAAEVARSSPCPSERAPPRPRRLATVAMR